MAEVQCLFCPCIQTRGRHVSAHVYRSGPQPIALLSVFSLLRRQAREELRFQEEEQCQCLCGTCTFGRTGCICCGDAVLCWCYYIKCCNRRFYYDVCVECNCCGGNARDSNGH